MKIQNTFLILPDKQTAAQKPMAKTMPHDVFERTSIPSFKGMTEDGIYYPDDPDILQEIVNERLLRLVMDLLSDKKMVAIIDQRRILRTQDLFNIIFDKELSDYAIILFGQNGINSIPVLKNYIRIYNNSSENRQIFKGQDVEALEIYSQLNEKDDLSRYGELLLYMYNKNIAAETIDELTDLNEITGFLKQAGLNKFKDFEDKYSYLGEKFNNFEDISDKYKAVVYLKNTYPQKTEYINNILQQNPQIKGINAEKIYAKHYDIIDSLYESNDGKGLEPLSQIINLLLKDVKKPALNQLSQYFNEYKTPEDKVDFYNFLNESSVNVDEVNDILTFPLISDNDALNNIINKDFFVKEIMSNKNCDEKQAFEIYKNYTDLLNAVYTDEEAFDDRLKTFFDITEMFNIKNSASMLSLYNNINGSKNKTITSQEFKEFLDEMTYCFSNKILSEAKSKKIPPKEILETEKQKYLTVKNSIEAFISEDTTGYFLGMNAHDVYLKYKDSINTNPLDVKSVLEKIINFNIENHKEYLRKTEKIKQFEGLFDNKNTLFEFINKSGIKFDGNPDDEEYIQNIQKTLSILKDSSSQEEYNKRIDYIIKSNFMLKSKNHLDKFFEQQEGKDNTGKVLALLIDKKAASVKDFLILIKKYSDKNNNYDNILNHLSNTSENIDFKEYKRILDMVNKGINRIIPLKLNNKNINLIDIEKLTGTSELCPSLIMQILNSLTNAEGENNFITKLPHSYTDRKKKYSSFEISQEIVNKEIFGDDPYKNITKKLKLDKASLGIQEECSGYIYSKAITKAIPKEFVDFVCSDDWITYRDENNKVPNLSLHARMRLIDRFALEHCDSVEDLYSDNTKEYINDVLKSIYSKNSRLLIEEEHPKNISLMTHYNSDKIKTVFEKKGKMLTIIAKGR